MDNAKLIERAIPDELRLAQHPDGKLVNQAIATVLVAINESSALTLNGQCKDIRHALSRYYEAMFVPHMTEEDELWNSLKAQAELAPKPHELAVMALENAAHSGDESAYEEALERAYEHKGAMSPEHRERMRKAHSTLYSREHKSEPIDFSARIKRELENPPLEG